MKFLTKSIIYDKIKKEIDTVDRLIHIIYNIYYRSTLDRQLDGSIHIINMIYWIDTADSRTERCCKFLIFSVQSKQHEAGSFSGKIFTTVVHPHYNLPSP